MRASRRSRPQCESMEARNLLSAATGEITTLAAQVASVASRHNLALNGSISGTYSQNTGIPDVGASQTFKGNGTVSPMGRVKAGGTLHLPGFIMNGHASGTLTLSGPRGSVSLDIEGPPAAGFSGAPSTFTYTIVSGTGRFKGTTGSGTGTLQEVPAHGATPGLPGQMTPNFMIAGQFTMTLHASKK